MIEQILASGEITAMLAAGLVTLSLVLGMMGLRSSRNRRNAIASAALMGGGVGGMNIDLRSVESGESMSERLFKPLIRSLTGFGRVLTPANNLAQWQRDLVMSGLINRISVTDFLGIRALVGTVLGIGAFFVLSVNMARFSALLFAFVPFIIGLYLPIFWLKSKVGARQKSVGRALPDALDMMSICVDAGLGFEAALQKVAMQWDNELTEEFRRALSEMRVGVSRSDALRHMVERTSVPDIASFVAVLVQADQLGIAIKDVLHTQAEQMRVKRRQRAQESAQKAPLKMLFPLVFFIFPSMFAVILGPAIPKLMSAFTR